MSESEVVTPIGWVRSERSAAIDDEWDQVAVRIELDVDRFDASALAALDTFSHVEVLFLFDQVDPASVCTGSRHPRGNRDWPEVGIFAQRAKDRPNRIGVTICEILGVDGTTVRLRGLDAIDGTPVLDLKPWMAGFAPRGEHREPSWATELMRDYW